MHQLHVPCTDAVLALPSAGRQHTGPGAGGPQLAMLMVLLSLSPAGQSVSRLGLSHILVIDTFYVLSFIIHFRLRRYTCKIVDKSFRF